MTMQSTDSDKHGNCVVSALPYGLLAPSLSERTHVCAARVEVLLNRKDQASGR
jgi:hypothetical protein